MRFILSVVVFTIVMTFLPFFVYASTLSGYTRTPTGATLDAPASVTVGVDLSGSSQPYARIEIVDGVHNANQAPNNTVGLVGSCTAISGTTHLSGTSGALQVWPSWSVKVFEFANSGDCSSQNVFSTVDPSDTFAVATATPPANYGVAATSTVDQAEENLYNAFIIFFITMFGMIWLVRKH